MKKFFLRFGLICLYTWRHIPRPLEPKAADLLLRPMSQYNPIQSWHEDQQVLPRKRYAGLRQRIGRAAKNNPNESALFDPIFFLATMFRSIVFAAFGTHFTALCARLFK